MKNEIRVCLRDINFIREQAKDGLGSLPDRTKLNTMTRSFTEGERVVVGYLSAVLHFLNSKGIDVSQVKIDLLNENSDSVNED